MRAARILPRGWGDFLFQLGLWLGFGVVYQLARGFADRNPVEAFENGRLVIDAERALHTLVSDGALWTNGREFLGHTSGRHTA